MLITSPVSQYPDAGEVGAFRRPPESRSRPVTHALRKHVEVWPASTGAKLRARKGWQGLKVGTFESSHRVCGSQELLVRALDQPKMSLRVQKWTGR